jgi:WD40 repeat protein
LATVDLPDQTSVLPDVRKYDAETGEIGGYASNNDTKVSIIQRLDCDGDVTRARYMPQNPNILATINDSGGVYVFDVTKHSLHPTGVFKPEMVLEHHTTEGWGVTWNAQRNGVLATCATDGTIAIWDLNKYNHDSVKLSLSHGIQRATSVNEVRFHNSHPDILGSVSDDGVLEIHDLRVINGSVRWSAKGSDGALNTLGFSPANEYLVAAGSGEGTVHIFDIRRSQGALHSISGQHSDAITALEWSPLHSTVLATGAADRRVVLWDVAKVNHQPNEDGKPSELLFIHAGHTAAVNDISWNPAEPWMIASVADDSHLEIWKPAATIVECAP